MPPPPPVERTEISFEDFRHTEMMPTLTYADRLAPLSDEEPGSLDPVRQGVSQEKTPSVDGFRTMRIDFGSERIVKTLAKRLKREVEGWGDTIRYNNALIIVVRMFGHQDYQALVRRVGLADSSTPDGVVGAEERAARYRQYVAVLSDNDFSVDEAERLIASINVGPWWDFDGRWTPSATTPRIRPAEFAVEFLDGQTVHRLLKVFRKSVRESGVVVEEGVRHLMAKLVGHESFIKLLAASAQGQPSIPDFFLAPESLDTRVEGYLRVLSDAGFEREDAISVLRHGYGGWLAIEESEWDPLRQARHANRVQNGQRPRWHPRRIGELTRVVHRRTVPVITAGET